jgi:hypothetical protein
VKVGFSHPETLKKERRKKEKKDKHKEIIENKQRKK